MAKTETAPLTYSTDEILSTDPVEEPLIAGGVRCHGGFDGAGGYVSPRTALRWPAIRAWQAQHSERFATPLVDAAEGDFPGHYPNVAQSRFLLEQGVTGPFVTILTRIGTVEGFGAMLRYVEVPEMQRSFVEDVDGTAMAHLGRGLIEAHARDEAGYGAEGGHKQMWYAARDIAFDTRFTEDQTEEMIKRMGLGGAVAGALGYEPLFPDVDLALEGLIARMSSILLIEISAAHTFAWAEELLADRSLVAGDGEASRIVSYVRQDEAPHVAYLQTALSEMRDRTFIGASGRKFAGTEVVGGIWERARKQFTGIRREQQLAQTRSEIESSLDGLANRGEILEEFARLGA